MNVTVTIHSLRSAICMLLESGDNPCPRPSPLEVQSSVTVLYLLPVLNAKSYDGKSTYLEESFSFLDMRWQCGGVHVVSFFLFGPRSSRHRFILHVSIEKKL